jgi:RimJ/RimL family protein N-acetyltransferase
MTDTGDGHLALRPVQGSDLDGLFAQVSDPESVAMAAFTSDSHSDRAAFDAWMARLLTSPDITVRAITVDGELVGSIASFVVEEQTEVSYWIERTQWGRGIASRALALFVQQIPVRPLYARAARDNIASLRVMEKVGFRPVGTEISFATARGTEIEETILRLGPESPATVDA